ncbi:MAG: chromosome partitioning protein ParB, partial [Acidobacteriota bacterium]|nr:chromosome partitioning protein ParB [Acidobacteriota bacterium]
DILKFIEEEKLTAGHGRALLMAQDADSQRRITKAIIDKSLSVREAEKAVKRSNRIGSLSIDTIGVTAKKDPNLVSAETKLRRKLGTNVNIIADNKGGGGKVEIEYYSEEDLNRIYQVIIRSKA